MHFIRLLAPAALVALASAQFYDEDQFDILAREEAPGYDDLGVLVRDVDHDDFLNLKTREAEAEPEELIFSEATDVTLAAREADQYGEFDSLISLEERDAEAEAEPSPEPKKRKNKKKSKKRKSKKRKGRKNRKNRKHRKNRKNRSRKNRKNKSKKSPAQKKKLAAIRKQAKEDSDIWG